MVTYGSILRDQLYKHNARGLSDLVMHGADIGVGIRCRDIDPEVPDLAEEPRRADIPFQRVAIGPSAATSHIDVGGQETQADKASGGLENWPGVGIADELCAEGQRDAAGDEICAWREVHNGVLGRRAVAVGSAAFAVVNSSLNGGC